MSDIGDFIERVKALTIADLGSKAVDNLKKEAGMCTGNTKEMDLDFLQMKLEAIEAARAKAESDAKAIEAARAKAESDAKLAGTFLEDCDGLWEFNRKEMPKTENKQLDFFRKIARQSLMYRDCYEDIFAFQKEEILPEPSMKSLGTNSSMAVQGQVDIFHNEWNNERAHLIPDSVTCAPKWGHCAEGALRPLSGQDEKRKNKERKLLVMGYRNGGKLRKKRQNFIKFSSHKELFDVDPSVVIIPILELNQVLDWEAGTRYEALVIASTVTKPGRDVPYKASSAYQNFLHHFNYTKDCFCSPKEIKKATNLLNYFLWGHAGSLAAGIPMEMDPLDPDNKSPELEEIMAALLRVQRDILEGGLWEPTPRKGKAFRPVLKVWIDDADPWLLAAKAAVNLSSTRGQKLLPACDKHEEEDMEMLQEFHNDEIRRRRKEVPSELSLLTTEDRPETPPPGDRSGVAVITPPGGENDWENLGD